MSEPLHIGWLIWGDEPGGVATAVLNNATQLQGLGQKVSLWTLGPGELADAAQRRGWAVHMLGEGAALHLRYVNFGFSPLGLLRRAWMLLRLRTTLRRVLGTAAPDVLCLPWPDLMLLAGPACRQLGIGLVLEMPNTPSRYRFDLNQRAYALATQHWRVQMLANSAFSASRLTRVPGVAVVNPAVDSPRFDPIRVMPVARHSLGIPAQAIVLGLIARLEAVKGADLLLSALAALGKEGSHLHLLLVGGPLDSDYVAALRAQTKAAGLEARVHWVASVPDPERYWAICDLAINARRDAEPFGLSIVEAMLMEKPVIAHALGQPAHTIDDGRTGWLYHRPDAMAITEALRRALAMHAQWPAMGRAARAEVLACYASETASHHYLDLLRTQAGQARRS